MKQQLPLALQNKWKQHNFEEMTPVQSGCFELICNQQDVVAISPTGTGKTLAYVLPLLTTLKPSHTLQVLVLVPSQELAQQVAQVWRDWSDLTVQTLAGGANVKRQIEKLKNKPDVIVATPGRLNDLAQQSKKIKFHQLKTIVLDEVDYLLRPEHLNTVRDLVKRAPAQRQLLFFSATQTPIIHELSKWFNTMPAIQNYTQEENRVVYGYIQTEKRKRVDVLKKLLQIENMQALVFVQHVAELALIYEKLLYHGLPAAALHSDMHHTKRQQALEQFKRKDIKLLLTTDVAARGLDIEDLPIVIHYDLPHEKEQFLHRSGRTGRMGKDGLVLALIETNQKKEYRMLLDKNIQSTEFIIQSKQIKSKS